MNHQAANARFRLHTERYNKLNLYDALLLVLTIVPVGNRKDVSHDFQICCMLPKALETTAPRLPAVHEITTNYLNTGLGSQNVQVSR